MEDFPRAFVIVRELPNSTASTKLSPAEWFHFKNQFELVKNSSWQLNSIPSRSLAVGCVMQSAICAAKIASILSCRVSWSIFVVTQTRSPTLLLHSPHPHPHHLTQFQILPKFSHPHQLLSHCRWTSAIHGRFHSQASTSSIVISVTKYHGLRRTLFVNFIMPISWQVRILFSLVCNARWAMISHKQ